MNPTRRPALLILLLTILLGSRVPVCFAQGAFPSSNADPRYILADTTLVRDTLGLTFERLFPLADSLRRSPAELRALSVTYRWTLARLLKMADSLDVPVDSVGPIMLRERFNPLANVVTQTTMVYTSTFTPQASGDSWINTLDHAISRGKAFARTVVTVQQDQKGKGGRLGSRETRNAATSLNWRLSPRFSFGTDLAMDRYDDISSNGLNGQEDRNYTARLTLNARPQPWLGFTPTVNLTGGLQNIDKLSEKKRGPNLQANATLRYTNPWFSHDLALAGTSSSLSASATDPIPEDAIVYRNATARDNSTRLRGGLVVLRGRPVEVNLNYQVDNTRTESPVAVNDTIRAPAPETTVTIHPVTNKTLTRVASSSIDGTVRIKPVEYANVDIGWRGGTTDNDNTTYITTTRSSRTQAFNSAAHADVGRLTLQATFLASTAENRYPKRDFPRGGYQEDAETHDLGGTADLRVTPGFSMHFETGISLNTSRYARIDSALTVPVAHDVANQFYKVAATYKPVERMSNTVSLKVTRTQYVNIPAASTASNTNGRAYVATWAWTYRLMAGLTANQTNNLTADYTAYPFSASSNRLSLDYSTITTIDAALGPRFTINVTHNNHFQPSGNYRPLYPGDPTEYLSRSNESINYSLDTRMAYSPFPAVSMNVNPTYTASTRNTIRDGLLVPERKNRNLRLSFGSSLNLQVAQRGRLTGSISRSETADRTIQYDSNGIDIRPRTSTRYLSGSMTFTWTL